MDMKKLMILVQLFVLQWLLLAVNRVRAHIRKLMKKQKAQERTGYTTEETATGSSDVPVVAPVETQPVTDTRVEDNYDNEPVRRENVSVVEGTGLKTYSVVVGSFGVKANAYNFQRTFKKCRIRCASSI